MILVYQFERSDGEELGLRLYRMDIRVGDRFCGVAYPVRAKVLMEKGIKGVRVSAVDRKILMSALMHQKIHGEESVFLGANSARLLELLLESGRGYPPGKNTWPLTKGKALDSSLSWGGVSDKWKASVLRPQGFELIPAKPPYALDPTTGACHKLKLKEADDVTWKWIHSPGFAPNETGAFLEKMSKMYPKVAFPIAPGLDIQKVKVPRPRPVLRVLPADRNLGLPMRGEPSFFYGDIELLAGREGNEFRWIEGDTLMVLTRKKREEQNALDQLTASGLRFRSRGGDSLFHFREAKTCYELDPTRYSLWSDFVIREIPDLEAAGWTCEIPGELGRVMRPDETDWYAVLEKSSKGWLHFEQGIEVEGRRINLLPVLQVFLKERRSLTLEEILEEIGDAPFPLRVPEGIVMIEGTRFGGMIERLFELFGDGVLDTAGRLRMTTWRAAELSELEQVKGWRPSKELKAQITTLRGDLTIDPMEPPETFIGELRPYQQVGLGWLDFLKRHRLSGILADDMGLGKTVQVIAALLRFKEQQSERKPFLIVSPSSVLPNWRSELRRFAPSLTLHTQHGQGRHLDPEKVESSDVILTTFGTMLRDIKMLRAIPFDVVVLDEAQVIKNPKAKITRAACTLQADLRVALSGTPYENHLGELRSLFHFALPGYLGDEKHFNAVLRHPIEKHGCPQARRVLQRKVAPLLLRRSKDVVAGELPPKTEIVTELELTRAQADLYEVVRSSGQLLIQEELKQKGFEKSRIQVLDLLLKLRQVCCDPRLRDQSKGKTTAVDACKLAWLKEVLPEMIEEGRRILLFSQFTSMLDLIKPELETMKIPFVEIRGKTKDRETPVKQFQAEEVPLFLISLKAGGTGLNLTAADTVIFYDPWWNPAVESQAADRSHRIGQDKPVFVYKLICSSTVESRILELQERKKELMSVLDSQQDTSFVLTESDLDALIAPVAE